MDKLLCAGRHEKRDAAGRRTPANDAAGHYLEAVESTIQTGLGLEEAGSAGMAGKENVTVGRPLPICGTKILPEKSRFQRNTDQARPGQSSRLLLETTCFEIESNRRMPNGTSGGVRGGGNLPLLDCFALKHPNRTQTIPNHLICSMKACILLALSRRMVGVT